MIWSLILGGIAGWIASMIMKKDAQMGIIANVIVGIIGGAIGSWVFGLFGLKAGGNIGQIVVGVVGAVILLAIINAIQGKK
ncbi:MAG: GlsB/YeaQ/YmgE family stress response membrane protein [Peptoniphilaceae bacterium]|nr:GlsB/YeaQ/YmgE family stress response membrane protein [Peptoniphilaceae bacterium]MDY6018155.1 GlsB/YeaQ/YmgE family stress response membrane protein [Anaerococcus sp.]